MLAAIMEQGLTLTLVGVSLVFVFLFILVLVLRGNAKIVSNFEKKDATPVAQAPRAPANDVNVAIAIAVAATQPRRSGVQVNPLVALAIAVARQHQSKIQNPKI